MFTKIAIQPRDYIVAKVMEVANLILYVIINFPKENMYWPIELYLPIVRLFETIHHSSSTCTQQDIGRGAQGGQNFIFQRKSNFWPVLTSEVGWMFTKIAIQPRDYIVAKVMEVANLILYVIINFPKENMYWPIDHLK